jgi:hypothetical protein
MAIPIQPQILKGIFFHFKKDTIRRPLSAGSININPFGTQIVLFCSSTNRLPFLIHWNENIKKITVFLPEFEKGRVRFSKKGKCIDGVPQKGQQMHQIETEK